MFKTKLQEYCQSQAWLLPCYGVTREGADHCPRFKAVVDVNGSSFTSPDLCRTSKEAQNLAAKLAFEHFTGCMATDNTPVSSSTQLPETPKISQIASSDREGIHMYKNRLQTYAQKRNLELPVYSVERAGPSHASCFKCKLMLEGKTYESEDYFQTVKEAESAAAKVAFESIYPGGFEEDDPSIYKNLLQEFLQKEKELSCLPRYSTTLEGPPHRPVFVSAVEIQTETFRGQEAKTKKLAELYAAKVAYIALRERKCKKDGSINAQGVHMKKALQLSSANVPEGGSDGQPMLNEQVEFNPGNCKKNDSINAQGVHMKKALQLSSANVPEGGSDAQPMLNEQVEFNQDKGKEVTPNSSTAIQELKPTLAAKEPIFWSNNPISSCSKPVDGLEQRKGKKKIIVLPQSSTRSYRDATVRHSDEKWIAITEDSS